MMPGALFVSLLLLLFTSSRPRSLWAASSLFLVSICPMLVTAGSGPSYGNQEKEICCCWVLHAYEVRLTIKSQVPIGVTEPRCTITTLLP